VHEALLQIYKKHDSPRIIEERRQYSRDFDHLTGMTTTVRDLYDKMLELCPDRANPGLVVGFGACRQTLI
jgi:hypothetical protein